MYYSKYFPGMYIKLVFEWLRPQFSIMSVKDTFMLYTWSITEIAFSITNILKLILIHNLNLSFESENDDNVAYVEIIHHFIVLGIRFFICKIRAQMQKLKKIITKDSLILHYFWFLGKGTPDMLYEFWCFVFLLCFLCNYSRFNYSIWHHLK